MYGHCVYQCVRSALWSPAGFSCCDPLPLVQGPKGRGKKYEFMEVGCWLGTNGKPHLLFQMLFLWSSWCVAYFTSQWEHKIHGQSTRNGTVRAWSVLWLSELPQIELSTGKAIELLCVVSCTCVGLVYWRLNKITFSHACSEISSKQQ